MTSARGTSATSACASPDGAAYHVLAWRRSGVPPAGMVIDHGGGGGGSGAASSSVGAVGLGGGGGGGGAAGSAIEIVVAEAHPGRAPSGSPSSAPASSAPDVTFTSGWSWA